MKQISFCIALIGILVLSSCAMSPVRKVLPAENLAINVTLGGAVIDNIQGFSFLPVPANISVGIAYGLSDQGTAGLNLYPLPLIAGILFIEPYGVCNFVQQDGNIPNVNAAFSLPFSISFSDGKVGFYPTITAGPAYENETGLVYTALELTYSTQENMSSLSWKVGGEWKAWSGGTIGGEIGLMNIGQESVVSPLSRVGFGIPVFLIGSTFYILVPEE